MKQMLKYKKEEASMDCDRLFSLNPRILLEVVI